MTTVEGRDMTGLLGPVCRWVDVYTAGLAPTIRDRRRAEIESDVWEQVDDLAAAGSSRAAIRLAVWTRTMAGAPDDLFWRLEQPRTSAAGSQSSNGRGSNMNLRADRSVAPIAALVALAIVAAAVAITVDNIQYMEQSQRLVAEPTLRAISIALFGIGLAGIPVGFLVMRSRPVAGAVLAAGGSVVAALMTYWLIVPLLVAVVISVTAIRRARRIAAASA